ncbi:MAG: terminase small subunit protein [Gammaproteobacteria bacterium]|nr:terminase small subunit protein [Gammaproteobacteria bacterium]MBU1732270.1 terminase small subunit protein [Gammaproteobacteria bacterium]MBU1893840.1 terminase small subunit protein [Gammaproteobacteria bacterium]
MKKIGRPSSYNQEIAAEICERLSAGESLRAICRDAHMPERPTVSNWLLAHPSFFSQYTHARDIGLDVLADQVIEIADERPGTLDNGATDGGDVANRRLRFDARRWYLSKLAPKRYGDRTSMELTGKDGGPVEITDTERAAKIAAILAAAEARKADADDLV